MLRKMRENFKSLSWTLWLVIIVFVGGFIVFDGLRSGSITGADSVVATVGNTEIQGEEFRKNLAQILDQYRRQLQNKFNSSIIDQLRIPEQILQGLINSTIIRNETKNLNITVTDKELKEKIINHPQLQRDGKFIGTKTYETLLAQNRIRVKDFENDLRDRIKEEKLRELITGTLVVSDSELKEMYKKENDNAELDVFTFRPDKIEDSFKFSEDEQRQYYENNKKNLMSPERRAGRVIALKYDDFKKELNLTPQEIYDYFKENKKNYVLPEKAKVSRIFLKYDEKNRDAVYEKAEKITADLTDKNFAEKAKLHSEGDKADNGGDWGYWEWKRLTNQETKIIESHKQGYISAPVDTFSGFSIIWIAEKTPERQESFDEVKDKIQKTLEKQRLNELVKGKLDKIYNRLNNKSDIKTQLQSSDIQITDTDLLTNGQQIKDLDEMGYISRKLFSLKMNEIEFPVDYMKGMAIVQLTAVQEPQIEKFENVKDKINQELTQQKKMEILTAQARSLTPRLRDLSENKLEDLIKQNDISKNQLTYKRGNKLSYRPVMQGLDELIFSLQEQTCSDPIQYDSEVVVVKLKKKKVTSDQDFQREKAEFYQSKLTELKSNYFNTYIYNKRNNYQVRLNQKLFEEIKEYVTSRYR